MIFDAADLSKLNFSHLRVGGGVFKSFYHRNFVMLFIGNIQHRF